MENSPFNRSGRTARTPPPTPAPAPAQSPARRPTEPEQERNRGVHDAISTPELQSWMTSIEHCLNDVCSIAAESKMNSDQKLRVNTLMRKLGHATSQLVVQYQSLKLKAVQAYSSVQTLQDQADLSQRMQDLKQIIETSSKPDTGISFADVVKKGANNYIQTSNLSSVAIYPQDKLKSCEETKSLVQKIIRPEQINLHVRGLRNTKNGGIIISTDRKEDIEKLKKSEQLIQSGLTIDETQKRRPRIAIIGVPTSISDKEVLTYLYHQNLAHKLDIGLEEFLNTVKLSHKSGKRDATTCNFIIEVPAIVRKALIASDRVFINWSSCPIRDFTLVTRCFKCQQYGHAAKTCRETINTCGHCGDQGHTIDDCSKKAEDPKCATCLRFKKPSKHKTGALDCPAKIMAEKKYIQSIDYGCA